MAILLNALNLVSFKKERKFGDFSPGLCESSTFQGRSGKECYGVYNHLASGRGRPCDG